MDISLRKRNSLTIGAGNNLMKLDEIPPTVNKLKNIKNILV